MLVTVEEDFRREAERRTPLSAPDTYKHPAGEVVAVVTCGGGESLGLKGERLGHSPDGDGAVEARQIGGKTAQPGSRRLILSPDSGSSTPTARFLPRRRVVDPDSTFSPQKSHRQLRRRVVSLKIPSPIQAARCLPKNPVGAGKGAAIAGLETSNDGFRFPGSG